MNEVKLEDRVKTFEKEFAELLTKHQLQYIVLTDFPVYKVLPPEVQLAIKVIDNHGVQYRLGYSDNPTKK